MNVLRIYSIAKSMLHVNVKNQGILLACDIINFIAWLHG